MYQNNYLLIPKPLQVVNKFELWRKMAKTKNLSYKAKLRLEWIIFYYSAVKENAAETCKHFCLARSVFYYWLKRFDDMNLNSLEDKESIPKNKRRWNPDPIVLARMIRLRKEHIHWSKLKLSVLYYNLYGEKISSWQFQRVIQEFKLYPKRKIKNPYKSNGAKKQRISYHIRKKSKNLFSIDTKVLWLFSRKYYIITAIGHQCKRAYARAYTTHSSFAAADFLARLNYLLDGKLEIVLTDNGSEFQKHFNNACIKRNITRYYTKPYTPKDNPEAERFIKTMIEEWLNDGNWSSNLHRFNKNLTDFLITYNHVRPHQTLKYLTPLQYAEKHGLLSKRSSSSTTH